MQFWRVFRAFSWKNYLYLRYNWLLLVFIFGGCSFIIIFYLKSSYEVMKINDFIYEVKSYRYLKEQYFPAGEEDFIFYSSNSVETDDFMENCRQDLELGLEKLKKFENANEMRLSMERLCEGTCFAIEFRNMSNLDSLDVVISSTAMRLSTEKRYVNDEDVNGMKDDDDYIQAGFLTLQAALDREFMRQKGINSLMDFNIATIPSIEKEYMDSLRVILFGTMFNILLNVLLLSTFLIPLIEEKQNGLKSFLEIATPYSFLNGITFFLIRFGLYMVFLLFAVAVGVHYEAVGIVPVKYTIIFFMLDLLAAMTYTYLISIVFKTVFYAKVGGVILMMLPNLFIFSKGTISSISSYLFYSKSFIEALTVFQTFTNKHQAFTANDFNKTIAAHCFKLSSLLYILIAQIIVHCLLYLYLSLVFPGLGGQKQPYLFFLKPSFYKKRQRNHYTTSESSTDAIIIQDLVKKFKNAASEIKISDRLNMTIKNNHITVLLGHNGAGKTTTLNMIIGTVQKDSGKIIICSERKIESYHSVIGFCPQHSVFLDFMTCKEHLIFFALLRGLTLIEASKLSQDLLGQLNLINKENEYARNLSGGMKRRLSLGLAIAGYTKVIVLDEPSAGLDIEARREMWDVLLELRKTKAILITTHYMEEAEVLGDTVSILSNGRLMRSGSPMELKKKLGTGYILKLSTNETSFKSVEVLQNIQKFIPTANILRSLYPTVFISLPYNYRNVYSQMLEQLEKSKRSLGITSISVTDTSLDDVFLSCHGEEADVVDSSHSVKTEDSKVPYNRFDSGKSISWTHQFNAIFYKKIIFLYNDWLFTMILSLLPFACVTLAIILMKSSGFQANQSNLSLNFQIYEKGIVYVHLPEESSRSLFETIQKSAKNFNIEIRKLTPHSGHSIAEELMDLQKSNLAFYLQNLIGVLDINENQDLVNIYYSSNIYHSSTTLLNFWDNVLLQFYNKGNALLNITYSPIRRLATEVSPTRLEYYALIVPFGMFFFMFFFVHLPFLENESGFKSLQAVPRQTFWLANIAFDGMFLFGVCFLLFLYQKIIIPSDLYNSREQFIIFCTIFFYGISYLPILYSFANNFRFISTISTYLLFMFIVSAIMPHITSSNTLAMQNYETTILFLSLLPDFNLNHQLRIVNENFIEVRQNKIVSSHSSMNLANGSNTSSQGTFFLYAVLVFLVSWLWFTLILEDMYRKQIMRNLLAFKPLRRLLMNSKQRRRLSCEDGVDNVPELCDSGNSEDSDIPLRVEKLFKQYNNQKDFVVNNLNFSVEQGECFGLLGVNGAGKTTTFEMIAANIPITKGSIKINEYNIVRNKTQYRYHFGYCPQYDALNNYMTSYQILRYIGELRGLVGHVLDAEVRYWVKELEFERHKNIQIRYYSGGMKRKLNTAIAMIGKPTVALLDEPTTGVDPVARRLLWHCIEDFQKRGNTVVLTSHSMDECEHLCNRLGIMANGCLKCLGDVQTLKEKYQFGFTITIKIKDELKGENIENLMLERFSNCELRENHAGTFTFFISSSKNILWFDIFNKMEDLCFNYKNLIEDYSVNDSKLEDLILKFKKTTINSTRLVDV